MLAEKRKPQASLEIKEELQQIQKPPKNILKESNRMENSKIKVKNSLETACENYSLLEKENDQLYKKLIPDELEINCKKSTLINTIPKSNDSTSTKIETKKDYMSNLKAKFNPRAGSTKNSSMYNVSNLSNISDAIDPNPIHLPVCNSILVCKTSLNSATKSHVQRQSSKIGRASCRERGAAPV